MRGKGRMNKPGQASHPEKFIGGGGVLAQEEREETEDGVLRSLEEKLSTRESHCYRTLIKVASTESKTGKGQ